MVKIEYYKTIILFNIFLLIVYLIKKNNIIVELSIMLLILTFIFDKFSKLFYNIWAYIGNVLNTISTFFILFIFYFILFTPIVLISKLFNYKSIRKKSKKYNSYFITTNKEFSKDSFINMG